MGDKPMSHYHLEIVMPPTDDVKATVAEIMAQFDENADPNDEDASPRHAFWDWFVIGGRWSGDKVLQSLDADQLAAFYVELKSRKITVSGLQMGKQTLQPADQAHAVDALWAEFFPQSPIKNCPIFDNYKGALGDVMALADVPAGLKCERAIIAGPKYGGSGITAKRMVQETVWNGVSHLTTTWDGTLASMLAEYDKYLENATADHRAKYVPQPDWLVVTVDYHS